MTFAALVAAMDEAAIDILGDGEPVRYTPSPTIGSESVDVQGVFSASHLRADAGQAGVVSVGPAVFLRLDALRQSDGTLLDPVDDEDAIVTVRGVEYRIGDPQVDGQGGVLLFLQRAK
jgi:hypothetical protein